jgi:hypothetical protein
MTDEWPDGDEEWLRGRCQICDKDIGRGQLYPLCSRCESTARAHAKLNRAYREWEADGKP